MRRIAELDALRGIAAVLIVLFHLRFNQSCPLWGTSVDLFFVLSGYLITTILLDGEGLRVGPFLRTFYARRFLRIWPIYYLTLAVFLLVNRAIPTPMPTDAWPYYFSYTQFVQGYWSAPLPPFSRHFRHTWTLAIEEQFYLAWPLLVLLVGKRRLPWLIVPLMVAPAMIRPSGLFGHLLLTRCDGLALGALLAYLLHDRGRVERHARAFRAAFAAVMLAAASFAAWRAPLLDRLAPLRPDWPWLGIAESLSIARMAVFHFGLVGLVVCSAGAPWLRPLRARRLIGLGQISYGLYLYHPFVFVLVSRAHFALGFRGSPWMDALKVVACLAMARLSWRYIEEPILRLKDRFAYGPSPAAGSPLRGPHGPGAGVGGAAVAGVSGGRRRPGGPSPRASGS